MFRKVIYGKTKKEIIEYFRKEFLKEDFNHDYCNNSFIASDTKETILMSKLGLNCIFIIKNGKHTIERIYSKKQLITKRHLINDNLSCCTGPAIIYITGTGLYKGYYYINGIEYTRENYKKFINNALNLKSFNKYKKLTTLENIKLVLETYNKTEQLSVLNKKIELLKVIKNLEE